MGEDILYRLHKECEFETLETNDNYINSIFKNAEKYYSFPDTINGIEIKQMLPLGNFAFYILNCENLNFDKDILSYRKPFGYCQFIQTFRRKVYAHNCFIQ